MTGPRPPTTQLQKRAGRSRDAHRQYRRGPAQKRGVMVMFCLDLCIGELGGGGFSRVVAGTGGWLLAVGGVLYYEVVGDDLGREWKGDFIHFIAQVYLGR